MFTNTSFSVLFWLCKNRLRNGKAPVYARVTLNSKRIEISTHFNAAPSEWDARSQTVIGRSSDAKAVNNHLSVVRTKLLACYTRLEARGMEVTVDAFKNEYYGIIEKPRMLMQIIEQHNNDVQRLIGKDYAKATWVKYITTQKHIAGFLKWKFNRMDINLKELNYSFITDFEFYLKVEKSIDVNTNAKYIKNLKKIVRDCVARDWLPKDPFMAYKVKNKKKERAYLSEWELQELQQKVFTIDRLEQIKDIFLFSCYTGLAYVDVYNLTANHIAIGIDGEKWIFTKRQKTKTTSRIPLLPPALAILEKYSNHPAAQHQHKLLPVPSNQKTNAYLKEIGACCGIKKELTFHVARHTFATTVTLTNGIPIESVSKMLGHHKLQTTQHYAKILDKKVSADMRALFNKYSNTNEAQKTGS